MKILLWFLLSTAHAESVVVAERGTVAILLSMTGTVVPGEKIPITSPSAGRVEALPVPSQSPFEKRQLMAIIAGRDLAAIIDSNATTPQQVVQERWQKLYKPQKVRAPWDGFLLETRVGVKEYITSGQTLFIATPELSFETIIALANTSGMSPGMRAALWRPANPELKMPARIREILPGTPTPDKATLRFQILPAEDVATPLPGTVLDGQITVAERKGVLTVPVGAIRRVEGRSFVCGEVEEGMSDGVVTHIVSGLQERRPILTFP